MISQYSSFIDKTFYDLPKIGDFSRPVSILIGNLFQHIKSEIYSTAFFKKTYFFIYLKHQLNPKSGHIK